jgi:hypothetical protein
MKDETEGQVMKGLIKQFVNHLFGQIKINDFRKIHLIPKFYFLLGSKSVYLGDSQNLFDKMCSCHDVYTFLNAISLFELYRKFVIRFLSEETAFQITEFR